MKKKKYKKNSKKINYKKRSKKKFKSKKKTKINSRIKRRKKNKINKNINLKRVQDKSLILKFVRIQEKLKQNISINLKFDFLKVDKYIQSFFQKIDDKILEYRNIKAEETQRIKLENLEKEKKEKDLIKLKSIEEKEKKIKLKLDLIKEEEKLQKQRAKDLKSFLRKEQALLRKEQAERQKKFLQELRLEKQIERFRIREVKELEKLEKISLKERREDYEGLQDRIEKLKEKYRLIRDQKIRERVEALGVKTFETDDRETLLKKEKEYSLQRQKIELSLESFYRSAASLVFQLNKRHITRHMSIFRCIDRRFETGEIFIRWDESSDEEWLILIYIKDNSPEQGIIIEDKTNPEKNLSHEFRNVDIFKASDTMVDSLTQLIARKRAKNNN